MKAKNLLLVLMSALCCMTMNACVGEVPESGNGGSSGGGSSDISTPSDPIGVTYQVIFDCQGIATVPAQTIEEGGKAQVPNVSLGENYVFEGWTVNGSPFDFDTVITDDIVITLQYARLYSVSFDCRAWKGLSIPAQKIKEGQTAEMPSVPASQTYEFKSWLLNGEAFDFDTPITADITLVLDCEVYGSIV